MVVQRWAELTFLCLVAYQVPRTAQAPAVQEGAPPAASPAVAENAPAVAPAASALPQEESEEAKSKFTEGTQQNKAGDYVLAYELFTQGIATARTVELKSALFVSRSGVCCSMLRWEEALQDAEDCIRIRKSWSRSFTCQAAALEGLGRKEEAECSRRLASALADLKQDPKNEVGCMTCMLVYGIAVLVAAPNAPEWLCRISRKESAQSVRR